MLVMATINKQVLCSLFISIAICGVCSTSSTPQEWMGNTSITCSAPPTTTDCCDLECLHEGNTIQDSTIMNFKHSHSSFNLSTVINITNRQNIHLKGSTKGTTIECATSNQTMITFSNITNLYMENLTFKGCGVANDITDIVYKSAIGSLNIINCVNVTVSNVRVEGGYGVGLVVDNTMGNVNIENSVFIDNTQPKSTLHVKGGGMVINIGLSIDTTFYTIKNCTFISNKSPSFISQTQFLFSNFNDTHNDIRERGGGLHVTVEDYSTNNKLSITGCKFSNNSAGNGGGMFIMIKGSAKNNTITVSNTVFKNNTCDGGGGALQLGFLPDKKQETTFKNQIQIHSCTFEGNRAKNGGGAHVVSGIGSKFDMRNDVFFNNCTWESNQARIATAVDISIPLWETYTTRRYLPKPKFTNCTFIKNYFNDNQHTYSTSNAFVSTGFRVKFKGKTDFLSNHGTALHAISSTVEFDANSDVTFIDNTGTTGGAIALIGISFLFLRDNSTFLFENNTATESGGGVYFQSYDPHISSLSKSCFLQIRGKSAESVSMVFRNNIAGYSVYTRTEHDSSNKRNRGNSLFATTLLPCLGHCAQNWPKHTIRVEEALSCKAQFDFNFDVTKERRMEFSTEANHFASKNDGVNVRCPIVVDVNNNIVRKNENFNISWTSHILETDFPVVPGKKTEIPLKLVDDLCFEIYFLVRVQLTNSETSPISVHSAYEVITDNYIVLYGKPNDTGSVQLTTLGIREKIALLNVEILDCPPGYIHDIAINSCECSAHTTHKYMGIERCNESEFTAYIRRGYWVGYLNDNSDQKREDRLATALCPRGYCLTEEKYYSNSSEFLFRSGKDMCTENRKGILCGECIDNHSAYYHTKQHICGSNELCKWGWLFYILSELVPVTILFLVVIFFNISFTSGAINGAIFSMQVIDTIKINGDNFIQIQNSTDGMVKTYKFIYRMFSLNFFSVNELSFCLIQGASGLDMLAFKYVTIVYSLLLVVITVLVIKAGGHFQKLCRRYKKFKNINLSFKHSIIHGLSAFLVISYSECSRVTILILTHGTLRIGPYNNNTKQVAFYNGNYDFFGQDHLRYAIPALFFLTVIVIIPPTLLLSYPLCYKIFALLRIRESRCVQITCKIIPLEMIKPIFDSFQGAFKDRFRCFAGLYFFYRLFALLVFSFSRDFKSQCTLTGMTLILMLGLHAACRPYKRAWHNVLDAIIFANLAIINAITFYNYTLSTSGMNYNHIVRIMSGIQTALIFLPLVYLLAYIAYCGVLKVKEKCKSKKSMEDSSDDILYIVDHRVLDESLNEMSDYHPLDNYNSQKVQ